MRCIVCSNADTRVIDSRPADSGSAIRRRRECIACGRRFTTYEQAEQMPLMVVKKDGRREQFDPGKVVSGLVKACEKRPISAITIRTLAGEIEQAIRSQWEAEVPSKEIGEQVMNRLRELDEVAYVRFASVYRQFADVSGFIEEAHRLKRE